MVAWVINKIISWAYKKEEHGLQSNGLIWLGEKDIKPVNNI